MGARRYTRRDERQAKGENAGIRKRGYIRVYVQNRRVLQGWFIVSCRIFPAPPGVSGGAGSGAMRYRMISVFMNGRSASGTVTLPSSFW